MGTNAVCAVALGLLLAPLHVGAQDLDTRTMSERDAQGNAPTGLLSQYSSTGQTFRVLTPAEQYLDQFSFFIRRFNDGHGQNHQLFFRAYLMEWTDVELHAVGPVLWHSDLVPEPEYDTPPEHSFSTGGLRLDPNRIYVAFLSYSGNLSVHHGSDILFDVRQQSSYRMQFVSSRHGLNVDLLTTDPWRFWSPVQADFTADFSASPTVVPEPITMVLLGTGLLGIGGVGVVRRRNG